MSRAAAILFKFFIGHSVSKNRGFVKSNLKNMPQIPQARFDNRLKAPNRDSPVYPRNRKTRNDYLNNITCPTQKSNVFTHCTGTNTVGAISNRAYQATTEPPRKRMDAGQGKLGDVKRDLFLVHLQARHRAQIQQGSHYAASSRKDNTRIV